MKRSKGTMRVTIVVLAVIAGFGGVLQATPVEPTRIPGMRQPEAHPDGFLRNWYIYADTKTDGILDPDDLNKGTINNWWSSVSSGTMHSDVNFYNGTVVSAPYSHADYPPGTATAAECYAIPLKARTLQFYMSYSQMDNNTESNYKSFSADQKYNDFLAERHEDSDGWNLGWVLNDYAGYGVAKGGEFSNDFDMDILVHNGKSAPGATQWISNPQVSSSNHMSDLSEDLNSGGGTPPHDRVTVKWNDDNTAMAYDDAANQAYITWYQEKNPNFNVTNDDINDIGDSMDVHERNPSYDPAATANKYYGYLDPKDPEWVFNNLTDHADRKYEYQDAFTQRSDVFEYESIGGVIAGLAGYTDYDPKVNNWGDQQVIRIDLSQEALALVDEIVFYDFLDQLAPGKVVFGVMTDPGSGLRVVFLDENQDGLFNGNDYFMPENRIYIAQVENMVPEPMSLVLLGLGGLGLLKRRLKRNRA